MGRRCEKCGKGPSFGHNVSHANNVTNRVWNPNLQQIRISVPGGGTQRIKICTRCLRNGAFMKAVR